MTIICSKTFENGSQANFHRIGDIALTGMGLTAMVYSSTAVGFGAVVHTEKVAASSAILTSGDPFGDLEELLIAPGGFLAGGVRAPNEYVASLDEMKDYKWQAMKLLRAQDESSGFDVPGVGRFDSNEYSQNKIIGSVVAAQLSVLNDVEFLIDWTLADDSIATLDAQGMIGVGLALLAHINQVHAKGRIVRSRIESATSFAEVNSVTWSD